MPGSTLATKSSPSSARPRPQSWQQGDRVKLRDDVCHHARYRAAKGLIGVVELANDSDPFSPLGAIANVEFTHPDLPAPIRVTDIPYSYLQTAHPFADNVLHTDGQKPKRRSPLTMKVVRDTRTEAEKQAEGQKWLEDRGYIVLTTGQYKKMVECPCGCGHWFWPQGGYGNTPGTPDMLVTHPARWGDYGARRGLLAIEWKKDARAERKPEQVKLAHCGLSVFVWSLPMCVADIVAFERQMGFEPHPDALEYLERHTPKEVTA